MVKEEVVKDIKETKVEMKDLESKYLDKGIGTTVELQIAGIKKVEDPESEYNLSSEDFHYVIETTDGKLMSINSWALWNELRKCLDNARKDGTIDAIEGVKIRVEHAAKKDYKVTLIEE